MILKNNNTQKRALSVFIAALMSLPIAVQSQTIYDHPEQIKQIVLEKDRLFWQAYNQCNVNQMVSFLTSDLEFYHDKSGLTKGLDTFKKSLGTGLCADGPQLKRVVKEGSVEVFPLNEIGAIISGEHYFYVGDRADGLAKFTHVWTYKNNKWKMARVLSYNHQPVPIVAPEAIVLSSSTLKQYIGDYSGTETGDVRIVADGQQMKLIGNQFEFKLMAKDENTFFTAGQHVLFQFVKDEQGVVHKMIVLENGSIAEELAKTK